FEASYVVMKNVCDFTRTERKPCLVHAQVPLLGHHTSGVRKESYRPNEDMAYHHQHDPYYKLRKKMLENGIPEADLIQIEKETKDFIAGEFNKAIASPEPDTNEVAKYVFVPTDINEEKGTRSPEGAKKVMMV